MTRARIATPWPEQPVDYVRRPMDSLSMAMATRDRQMIEALRFEVWRQDIIDNQRRERRGEVVSSALVVVGGVVGIGLAIVGALALWAPWTLEWAL
jgi:hypothetical protein